MTPGSAVGLATDCAMAPGCSIMGNSNGQKSGVSLPMVRVLFYQQGCILRRSNKSVCSRCLRGLPVTETKQDIDTMSMMGTVNVLKIRTLVACQKGLDKQRRPRSDCFCRSSLIWVFTVCYSDKHFVNSSPLFDLIMSQSTIFQLFQSTIFQL